MSKAEKRPTANHTSQLRKELTQASKCLQTITASLDRLETSLGDCEAAIDHEKVLVAKIDTLQNAADELQQKHDTIAGQRKQETASRADAIAEIVREYDLRKLEFQKRLELEKRDYQAKLDSQERRWKQQLAWERTEGQRVNDAESKIKREIEQQLQKSKAMLQAAADKHSEELHDRELRVAELKKEIQNLKQDLGRHKTVLDGKETEIQMFRSRLSSIEAFRQQGSTDELAKIFAQIQNQVRDFCVKCVDAREALPGWNHFPEGFRVKDLPRLYLSESDAGQYVLIAAVQHSVCRMMKEHIFVPFGLCNGPEIRQVAEALHQNNRSHEAIWRLMTVNAVHEDRQLLESSRAKLQSLAKSMLASWKPFYGDHERPDLQKMATDLFVESHRRWLDLMKLQDRIHVVDEVSSQYFDSDSEDESFSIPGDFKIPDSTDPVLYLFPAFLLTPRSGPTTQPFLVRKGTAMFRDSPPLVLALSQEKEVPSPRLNHKKNVAV